jgi:hypothetical protein
MRLPCWGRPTARRPQRLVPQLLAAAALAPSLTQAIEFEPVPSPNLDLSSLGRIGVAGDFNGLSLYEYQGQNGGSSSDNGAQSLLAQLPNGAVASIVSTDATIKAMCPFTLSSGDMQGVVIGGDFTSLDGTKSTAIALFNPNTTEVTPLEGLEGVVNAVLCDQERETVYVGGSFRGANSTNAIAYVSNGWTNLPFAGFNGPVTSITKAENGHIIFGGSFTGLGNTSAPNEPDGQAINLSTANVTADNSASTNGFSNPKNIVCSSGGDDSGNTWLVQDDTPGNWDAQFGFTFVPTKLRLWNTHKDGRGTKTFRYIAFPIDGIMNLTYVDPATGRNASCSSECPLSDDREVEFQDFHFVNPVGMNRFRVAISDWYGAGAGLAGIELFQDNILAQAVSKFNEPTCRGIDFPSNSTVTGPWKESPSQQSSSIYLTAELTNAAERRSASVVFTPNIRQSGNYSVNMYTPGCVPDDTCSTRGRVNITGTMAPGSDADVKFTTSLFQTNNFEKYDQVYFGFVEKNSKDFQPIITLTALDGQDVDTLTIVAQSVGFNLINSTGGLNGLFDFDPEQAVVDSDSFEDSAINKLGATFNRNSGVSALVTSGQVLYAGGNFTSDDHDNIVAIDSNNKVQSVDGGLNGAVVDMYLADNNLYVGGQFTNTASNSSENMNFVAVLDTEKNEWSGLGAGVDGPIEYVVPFHVNISGDSVETAIAFSGSFEEIRKFGDFEAIRVNGLAIWVPSQNNWLQNLEVSVPSYSGILTAALLDLPNGDSLFAGSIVSAQLGANGIATLTEDGLDRFPVNVQNLKPSSNLTRRDILTNAEISGVVTGLFYEEDDQQMTILAGHFSAKAADGSTVNNLILVDGNDNDSVSGLGSEISADSTIVTVAALGSTLYAGGRIGGKVGDAQINGLVVYDINAKALGNQIPSVSGGGGTVSAITVRPDSTEVYIGGAFNQAGALDCPGFCVFDTDSTRWKRPGNDLGGDVSSLMWTSDKSLLVGGDLNGNDTETIYLAVYDAEAQTSRQFTSAGDLPGPVHVIVPASSDENEIWVAGTRADDKNAYVMKFDGDKWQSIEPALPENAIIRSLQIFQVTEGHGDTDTLGDKHVLMLTGQIPMPEIGNAAAVIYNGTGYQPYALATSSGNGPGSIAKIFTQNDNFFSSDDKNMPIVFVILIGLAIALGLILLLVLGGIILDRIRKKREGYTPAPTSMIDRGSGIQRIPPHELLESLGQGRPGAPQV